MLIATALVRAVNHISCAAPEGDLKGRQRTTEVQKPGALFGCHVTSSTNMLL